MPIMDAYRAWQAAGRDEHEVPSRLDTAGQCAIEWVDERAVEFYLARNEAILSPGNSQSTGTPA
jgi:hypothetical protein